MGDGARTDDWVSLLLGRTVGDGPLGDSATAGEPFRSAAAATADQPSIASGEKSCLELELKRLDDHGDDDHRDDDDDDDDDDADDDDD